jgi:hypothetical protein
MNQRTDIITASRVDLALLLLPEVGWLAAAVTLAVSGVPEEVAARVLALPLERRRVPVQALPAAR